MKNVLTFLLLLVATSSYAQTVPPIKKSTYVKNNTVVFIDGVTVRFIGSNTKARRDSAYRAAVGGVSYQIIGTGSGELIIKGQSNVNLRIKPGNYNHIELINLANVIIDGTGVNMTGGWMDVSETNNVKISGISITNQKYRAVSIRGFNTGLWFDKFNFDNIGNNVLTFETQQVYDGTDKTLNIGSRVANSTFNNVYGSVSVGTGFDEAGNLRGFSRGFKFIGNILTNSPTIGNWLNLNGAEEVEVSGNKIDNVNTKYDALNPNGTHNRLFSITGNGSVHDNVITNHQGNLTNVWGFSYGKVNKKVLIYNNYGRNSWKYGLIEIQVTPYLKEQVDKNPNLRYCDYEVYNNTGGQFSRSKDWDGVMLDLYNIYGPLKYYNNLGFDMHAVNGRITDMINANGGATSFEAYGNTYLPTLDEAIKFKAVHSELGAPAIQ